MGKFTKILLLLIIAVISFACGLQPPPSGAKSQSLAVAESPTVESTVMTVTADERLYVRTQPGGEISTDVHGKQMYLLNGDTVRIYDVYSDLSDTLWCAITPDGSRWVACRYLEAK